MAGLLIVLGSVLGFLTGTVAFFITDIGLFYSLAIWAASGPLALLLVVLVQGTNALAPEPQTETA